MRSLGVAAGLVALVFAAHPAAKAQTAGDVIKLGVSGRPDQAALELALRRGYFEQEGLKIETVQGVTGMQMLPSLATNQLQVASGSPNAALFNAFNRGIDIKIVADFAHIGRSQDRTVALIVRSDLLDSGAVKTIADLKGRSLSYGPGQGQITDVFFAKLLARAGLTKTDVTPRYLNFGDTLPALANKSLDGAFMVEPLVTVAEARKIARVMVAGSDVDPGAELSVVYYSPEFAKRRNEATRFMVAFLKGVRDYTDAFFEGKGKDAAIDLLVKYLPVKDKRIWQGSRQHTDVNGKINVADLKAQAAFYKKIGLVTGPVPDVDKYIDTSFAEAAVKRLGAR
jgi:NitT/TauT family transport system substrate-binding protein